jgi:hypothetical protein
MLCHMPVICQPYAFPRNQAYAWHVPGISFRVFDSLTRHMPGMCLAHAFMFPILPAAESQLGCSRTQILDCKPMQGCLMIGTALARGAPLGHPSFRGRPGRPWQTPLAAVIAGGKVTPPTSAAAVARSRYRRRRTPTDAGGKVAPPTSVAAVGGSHRHSSR